MIKFYDVQTIINRFPKESGVLTQQREFGPLLYVIFTANIPTHLNLKMATSADDTAVLSSNGDPVSINL